MIAKIFKGNLMILGKSKITLTSANSINIARWLPQIFYYFLAIKKG